MLSYIFIIIFNIIMILLSHIKNINKIILGIISFCVLLFFLGFGYLTGSDWMSYQGSYEGEVNKLYEVGFYYYMLFFKSLGFNFEMFRFFSTFIDLLLIYISAKRDTKYYFIFTALYFTEVLLYLELDGPMRQAKAVVLCIFSLKYIYKKKIIKYYLIVIIAILFHKTAILFLPIYYIDKIKLSWFKLIISILIIHLTQNIFLMPLLKFVTNLTGKYYFDSIYSLPPNNNLILEIGRQIIYLLPMYIIDRNRIYFKSKIQNIDIFYNLSFLFIIILNLSLYFRIISRGYLYFNYALYILYSFVFYSSKIKDKIIVIIVLIIISLKANLMLFTWKNKDHYRYVPYTNYIIELYKGNLLNFEEKVMRRKYENRNDFWD